MKITFIFSGLSSNKNNGKDQQITAKELRGSDVQSLVNTFDSLQLTEKCLNRSIKGAVILSAITLLVVCVVLYLLTMPGNKEDFSLDMMFVHGFCNLVYLM